MTEATSPAAALRVAIERIGGQNATARLLGVAQPSVWRWLDKAKPLPAEHVLAIEAATAVSRCDLRPDIYPPEPAPTAQVQSLSSFEHAR